MISRLEKFFTTWQEAVNFAHKNNIAVHYWTINDAEKMKFLQSIGADGIITDIPDVAYEVLNSQNKE